jgi:hypothetical protein
MKHLLIIDLDNYFANYLYENSFYLLFEVLDCIDIEAIERWLIKIYESNVDFFEFF